MSELRSGGINIIVATDDRNILVGGLAPTIAGVQYAQPLARLRWDGSLDPGFEPNLPVHPEIGSRVNSIAVQNDGKILVGGLFDVGLLMQAFAPGSFSSPFKVR